MRACKKFELKVWNHIKLFVYTLKLCQIIIFSRQDGGLSYTPIHSRAFRGMTSNGYKSLYCAYPDVLGWGGIRILQIWYSETNWYCWLQGCKISFHWNNFKIERLSLAKIKSHKIGVLASNSDFLILISLQPNVVDLCYFKLWILFC